MRHTTFVSSIAGMAAAAAVAGTALATNGITQIPLPADPDNPDGGNSLRIGSANLSDDGQVLAGRDNSGNSMLWTASGGAQSVPVAYASGISGNGQVVFGTDATFPGQATRWSRSGQSAEGLGYLPASFQGSFAYAASTDGSVIAGASFTNNGSRAFRWTSSGGMQDLGVLNPTGAYRASEAYGASGDGSVIAGYSTIGDEGAARAIRWTSSGGMQDLGTLAGDATSWANGVSKDGTTVVGHSTSAGSVNHAFRWTAGAGMVGLGELAAGYESDARGANADGSLIVGTAGVLGGNSAFIWSAATGMVNLNSYLTLNGFDLGGVTFTDGLAISADGSTILANGFTVVALDDGNGGTYDQQVNGSYIINLPTPGAMALLGLAGLAGARRRRA
jgi:probable HAF family extracellular repeat protein